MLIPYLVKAKESLQCGPSLIGELVALITELINKIEQRAKVLLTSETHGQVEKRHNEIRLQQVEEWRATVAKCASFTESASTTIEI